VQDVLTADRVEEAGRLLAEHRLQGRAFDGFPQAMAPVDDRHAYAIQDAVHRHLAGAGRGAQAGHKIGCTTAVMQAFLGIPHPSAGGVLASTVWHGDAEVPFASYVRPGVECELAVRLGEDLPPAEAPFHRARIRRAVDAVMAAIELVDDRYVDYPSLDAYTLIADDFFGAGCVLGEEHRDWRDIDLGAVLGRMTINGVAVGEGYGRDILGDPLAALQWLADDMARRGQGLRAGSFVSLGSVVATQWVAEGDRVVVEFPGELGRVAVTFGGRDGHGPAPGAPEARG
jgi:2-keto-4-pentenoate hydratase